MSANFETILILGATSGIGEAFTRRFHAEGKKVIAAGRRVQRLEALKKELKGLEIFQIDVTDFINNESKINILLKTHPDIDTVMMLAGIMNMTFFKDPSTSENRKIIDEVNTNLTAPIILSRLFVPHFLSLKKPASIILTSSGLAYIPFALFPTYSSTKMGIHALAVVMRAQLVDTNVKVIELVAPYVDTPLDAHFREPMIQILGGPEKAIPPMPLNEYMDKTMILLKGTQDKEPIKEVAVGYLSETGVGAWRQAYDPLLKQFGTQG